MKFRVERDALADAVAFVARSLPSRAPVPVLGGVLIDAEGDAGLTVSGFDYEVSARVEVPAMVGDPGRVLVSGRLLADITRSLPPHPVDVTVDGPRASIVCGNARFSLPTMSAEDYPQLPQMPPVVGALAPEVFAQAVSQVAVAAGRDDTLPMLTGIRVEIEGSSLTMAATDRFRLAVREFSWEPGDAADGARGSRGDGSDGDGSASSVAILAPARTLSEAAKTLTASGSRVELALGRGDGLLGLAGGGRRSTTRLLDAEFPRYRQLLPKEHTSAAVVEVAPLVDAIKRVSLVAERGTQVRLEFDEGSLRLTAGGDDEGSAEEQLPCSFAGEPLTIAFNPGYLLDGLGALGADHAHLSFTTPSRPALLRPAAGPDSSGSSDEATGSAGPGDVDEPTATAVEPGPDGATQLPEPRPGYLYLLMPVRLPG